MKDKILYFDDLAKALWMDTNFGVRFSPSGLLDNDSCFSLNVYSSKESFKKNAPVELLTTNGNKKFYIDPKYNKIFEPKHRDWGRTKQGAYCYYEGLDARWYYPNVPPVEANGDNVQIVLRKIQFFMPNIEENK